MTENEITYIDVAELETSEAGRKASLVCLATEELKAQDITILDVRKQTIIADYFVVCSGTSTTHIQSIARSVLDKLRENGYRSRPEGDALSLWVVLDYGDVILHVMGEETREFYDLERLWAEAPAFGWPVQESSE